MRPKSLEYSDWLLLQFIFIAEHFLGVQLSSRWIGPAKNQFYLKLRNKYPEQKQPNIQLKDEKREQAFPSNKLRVFRGGAADWEACQHWNFDFFQQNYGDRIIELNASKGLTDPESPQETAQLSLKEYIDEVKTGTKRYLKLSDLVNREPELQKDLKYDWLKRFRQPFSFSETYYTFMGAKGSVTPMHNEFPCNVYVQVSGVKKWILYPAGNRYFLNARTERRPYFFSEYQPDKSDASRFPLHHLAEKVEVILHPGDVLWVPPFMWHYVENVTDSIGVAYKFVHIPSSWKASRLLTILFFLSTRPSIFYSFVAGKIRKKDLIIAD
jgi:hypothetical protein